MYCSNGITWACNICKYLMLIKILISSLLLDVDLDLTQVDLMNFRVEYVYRPRSGRCLGREAAERATKSREVDLSRLKGFHLRFICAKNEE